ncbi:MAG: diphthine--ammonia ligase [Candidatus Bathyarchaeota archaeon]|nr:diphthine--ammonia ligase [Candidatus Bathyarchaeota archaeon]MDH5532079.1 diphthine--ammonia ligase [Candidatus Bathyarchaeota archaeon]MDH5712680.1 diphthine--ammonia ligase [Candidatus Bathyarchaeota archaeon]
MKVVASWSGGKESCFACYTAMLDGFEVSHLLNFVSKEERCMSHGLDPKLIVAQSQAIGIPIIQREVTWDTYEEGFKTAMMKLKQMGIEGAVFGDIDIQEHKDWVNRVCSEVGIIPMEPLWGLDPEHILTDFIDEGFEAIVINVKADLFGEEWLGRKVDRSFLEDLRKLQSKRNIHICGELGEYHTLVTDGPFFKRRVKILDNRKVLKEGYWKYWLLDISRYEIEEKR